ncbi:MAG: hypothetical protein R2830_10790 [Saprospiraceae bacterium]
MKNIFTLLLAFFAFATLQLQAQATLSIQGTVQNSTGAAVTDGSYSLTFKLYTQSAGGTAIWTETQSGIPIQSGVYSAELGAVETLNVPFNATYFLGVSVDGGAEMAPRAKLTSAPYALSLRGQENVFGSTGNVGIGDDTPDTKLHVKDGQNAIVRAEAPGIAAFELNRTNGTQATIGYVGTDVLQVLHGTGPIEIRSSGNTDVYNNGTKRLGIESTGINVTGDVELGTGGNIKYGANNDWRLVDVDDFSTGNDGWGCQNSWNNGLARDVVRVQPQTPFSKGWMITPGTTLGGDSDDVLYKQFDLSGHPHTMVKVVFTYHVSGNYDPGEIGFAAFSTGQTPSGSNNNNGNFQVGWVHNNDMLVGDYFNGLGYVNDANTLDYNVRGEMIAQTDNNTFYVLVGVRPTTPEPLSDERYYISDVEIWVK